MVFWDGVIWCRLGYSDRFLRKTPFLLQKYCTPFSNLVKLVYYFTSIIWIIKLKIVNICNICKGHTTLIKFKDYLVLVEQSLSRKSFGGGEGGGMGEEKFIALTPALSGRDWWISRSPFIWIWRPSRDSKRVRNEQGVRDGAVGWGTALQVGRSRVRFRMASMGVT